MGTYPALTEDDNEGTLFTKAIVGQESPHNSSFTWWRIGASPKGNSQPPVNGEREKEWNPYTQVGRKGKFLGYRTQNKYGHHFSTFCPELLAVICNLLYLVCPLQSKHARVPHQKETRGFCPDVKDIFHAKTESHLPVTLFVSKTSASPRREHQEHLLPF